MKIVLNKCYGGFSLSSEASEELNRRKGKKVVDPKYGFVYTEELFGKNSDKTEIDVRSDKDLVSIVEEMKDKANGSCARLYVFEVPDSNDYYLDEYDGIETLHKGYVAA